MTSYPFKILVSPDVISQEVLLGETVLMNVKTLAYFGLDELGSHIWREIEGGGEADEVYRRALSATGLAPEQLDAKFTGMLDGLSRSGIIELRPVKPSSS